MLQQELIERTRALCRADDRVVAALMYGSFTYGEGDEFSDVEFVLFFADEALPGLDRRAWVEQVAPVALFFADDLGHYTAIFESFVRAEFHFDPASRIQRAAEWRGNVSFPSLESTLVVDRTGALTAALAHLIGPAPERDTPDTVERLANNFVNWMLFGANVFDRGELARALEILGLAHRYLLWMVRLDEQTTEHWPTPSRGLEQDISPAAYERFRGCTAALDREPLRLAYGATWRWGAELMPRLTARHGLALPVTLLAELSRRLANQDPGLSV